MLSGKKCKVGNKTNHFDDGFKSYDGVIASEAQMNESGDFMAVVLTEGNKTVPKYECSEDKVQYHYSGLLEVYRYT